MQTHQFSAFLTLALMATSSLSAPLASPNAAASTTTSKAGIAVERWEGTASKLFTNAKFQWAYNWNGHKDKSEFAGNIKEYVPMCWGQPDSVGRDGKDKKLKENGDRTWAACARDIKKSIGEGKVKHILGFNEPDHADESNMSVDSAVAAWKTHMQPYAKQSIQLGSPAVTSMADKGHGLDWLESFLEKCNDCTIDFITLHYYANPEDKNDLADAFKKHIERAKSILDRKKLNKPIWVTEVGILPGKARGIEVDTAFMKEVISWMDKQPYIERYAYFGTVPGDTTSSKMVENGKLNQLGQIYNSI